MSARLKRLKMRKDDSIICRGKRKKLDVPFCPFVPLPGSTRSKNAFTTTPKRRTIVLPESDSESEKSRRHLPDHSDAGFEIKVPTKICGKLSKGGHVAIKTAVFQPCITLPPSVPNVLTVRHMEDSCLDLNYLETGHLYVYGWEYKTLLRHSESLEYDAVSVAHKTDSLGPLVPSGIVTPLDKRRRQQTKWFDPKAKPWTLDGCLERHPHLTPRRRGNLLRRIAQMTDDFGYSSHTFHLAVSLMDKSLACTSSPPNNGKSSGLHEGEVLDYRTLRRLECAWFWIAAKMEEPDIPPCASFVSDSLCTEEELRENESDICKTLQFRLHHITPIHYAPELLLACEASFGRHHVYMGPFLHDMLYYLLELSRFAHELVPRKPSLVAAGCLLLARATLQIYNAKSSSRNFNCEDCWNGTLRYYTGKTATELEDTVRILHSYQVDAGSTDATKSSTLSVVFNKYSKAKFMSVSLESAPDIEMLFPDLSGGKVVVVNESVLSTSSQCKDKFAANHEVISISSSDNEVPDTDVISIASSATTQAAPKFKSVSSKHKPKISLQDQNVQVISLCDNYDDDDETEAEDESP